MSISATLIVRNEEAVFDSCLTSLHGVVDEIVVIDTGSTDATPAIAERHGARLYKFAWCDDFSAARNFAIEQATSDWLLYIDADERLRPLNRAVLLAELAQPDAVCAMVHFRPRTGFTAYPENRLYRRHPEIRFRGAMHETIRPDVMRLIEAGRGRIVQCSLAIDHVGYDGDQSHKFERNLRLLALQIPADPSRAYLRWHLGTIQAAQGDIEDAEMNWRLGAELAMQSNVRRSDDVLSAIELAKLALQRGGDPSAWIAAGEAIYPGNRMLAWLRGKALLAAGCLDAAEPIFAELAAIDPDAVLEPIAYDARIFGARAWAELAEAAMTLREHRRAAEWFARAEALAPGEDEFRVKRQFAATRVRGDIGRPA